MMIPSHQISHHWENFNEQTHLPLILRHQEELYTLNFVNMKFDQLFYGNIKQWYTEGIQRQGCHSHLLFDELGSLIGFYLYQMNETTIYLMQMFVEKSYRGKGYGTMILEHYENMGKQDGARASFLHASSVNHRAVSFYERNHYATIDMETDEDGYPRYLMFKNLTYNQRDLS